MENREISDWRLGVKKPLSASSKCQSVGIGREVTVTKEKIERAGDRDWLDQGTTMCMSKGNYFDNELEQSWDLLVRRPEKIVKKRKKK